MTRSISRKWLQALLMCLIFWATFWVIYKLQFGLRYFITMTTLDTCTLDSLLFKLRFRIIILVNDITSIIRIWYLSLLQTLIWLAKSILIHLRMRQAMHLEGDIDAKSCILIRSKFLINLCLDVYMKTCICSLYLQV